MIIIPSQIVQSIQFKRDENNEIRAKSFVKKETKKSCQKKTKILKSVKIFSSVNFRYRLTD